MTANRSPLSEPSFCPEAGLRRGYEQTNSTNHQCGFRFAGSSQVLRCSDASDISLIDEHHQAKRSLAKASLVLFTSVKRRVLRAQRCVRRAQHGAGPLAITILEIDRRGI